jgi:shikimate kinase
MSWLFFGGGGSGTSFNNATHARQVYIYIYVDVHVVWTPKKKDRRKEQMKRKQYITEVNHTRQCLLKPSISLLVLDGNTGEQ